MAMRFFFCLILLLTVPGASASFQNPGRQELVPDEQTAVRWARLAVSSWKGAESLKFKATRVNAYWVAKIILEGEALMTEHEDYYVVIDASSGRIAFSGIQNLPGRIAADVARLPNNLQGTLVDGDRIEAVNAVWRRYKQGPGRASARLKDYTADIRKRGDGLDVILYYRKESGGAADWPGVRYRLDARGKVSAVGRISPAWRRTSSQAR